MSTVVAQGLTLEALNVDPNFQTGSVTCDPAAAPECGKKKLEGRKEEIKNKMYGGASYLLAGAPVKTECLTNVSKSNFLSVFIQFYFTTLL